jgi:GDP-L-fucose synthase
MTELISKKIYVAGHAGMVGQAVVRTLNQAGAKHLITRSRRELDLRNQAATQTFFKSQCPDLVIFAAGKVGGIHANNTYPAEFIYDNLIIAANAIEAAYRSGVQRFLYLGSSCIYPRMAPQPISEESLLTGPLEKTNEAYALAKIAGLKMCQYYRSQYGVLFHSAMPTNLYGPGDNYHPENSHVVPALIRRFHEAKKQQLDSVTIWGTGKARREFLHVDDLAAGLWHLCQLTEPPDVVNLGTGTDVTIFELAKLVANVVGFQGSILTDPTKPDGTPVKLTDIRRAAATGWRAAIDLESGLRATYRAFLNESSHQQLRET